MRLVIVCFVATVTLSAVLPEGSAGYGGLDSLEAVRAQLQLKYKQLLQNPATINETQTADNRNISSLKAFKSDLLDQYLKRNHTDSVDNIDNGNNNSINGKGNQVITGDSNSITGYLNEVDGNENHIKGSQNVVHGSNNVILDKPLNSSEIQIPSMPIIFNSFLNIKTDPESNSTHFHETDAQKGNNQTKSQNSTYEKSNLSQEKTEPSQNISSNTVNITPSDQNNPTKIANNSQEALLLCLALFMLLMTIVL